MKIIYIILIVAAIITALVLGYVAYKYYWPSLIAPSFVRPPKRIVALVVSQHETGNADLVQAITESTMKPDDVHYCRSTADLKKALENEANDTIVVMIDDSGIPPPRYFEPIVTALTRKANPVGFVGQNREDKKEQYVHYKTKYDSNGESVDELSIQAGIALFKVFLDGFKLKGHITASALSQHLKSKGLERISLSGKCGADGKIGNPFFPKTLS